MRNLSVTILKSDFCLSVIGWLVLGGSVLALYASGDTFWIYVAGLTVIYAISALGLDWIQGRAGQVSIGSAAFMAIGAFVCAVAYSKNVPVLLAIVLAALAGALVGLLVGLPALRLKGLYLALATLALQFITNALGNVYETSSGQIAGVAVGPTTIGPISMLAGVGSSFFIALVILLVLTIIVLKRLYRRAPGRAWLAVKESEMSAGVIGIDPVRWKLSAFVGSSALISISGALLGLYTLRVQSESFSLDFAITFVAMVIVGGLGSIGGVIAGAVLITVTPYLLSTLATSLPSGLGISQWLQTNVYYINSGLYGILLLAFLLFQPRGIAGAAHAIRVKLVRRLEGTTSPVAATHQTHVAPLSPIELTRAGTASAPTVGGGPEDQAAPALLQVTDIHVYRAGACAVDGVDLTVGPGEVVGMLGRNGAGKTSTLRGISGFFLTERARVTGNIVFDGRDIRGMSPMATAKLGLVLVPEREKVFPNLSVAEHFRAIGADKSDMEETFALFPQLEQRVRSEAGLLSGGERQMLALGVAFCMHPKLLLVDELSLGLAPGAISKLSASLKEYQERTGIAVLLVEQNVSVAIELADRIYVLEAGHVEVSGPASEMSEQTLMSATLGG
jgi:ABC-type branched-subunit amino acid transport system ATPase component/ABC-type branched-subunit amino acid transport system permease subunit